MSSPFVSMGLNTTVPNEGMGVADYTFTDPVPEGEVIIYPHAYSLRVTIDLSKTVARQHLARCGWSQNPDSVAWKTYRIAGGKIRSEIRGSVWLTGRKPSNPKRPLFHKNRKWKTGLYAVAIEEDGDGYSVDLRGARRQDIERFMAGVLQLPEGSFRVAYYRAAERYVTLAAQDAHRLARGLDGQPEQGRGNQSRKEFILKVHQVPVTVKHWTKMVATLTIYRISRGATAAYRCEAVLKGKRRNRHYFNEADIVKLDRILLDLVARFDLHPRHKPARWEPRNVRAPVERGLFDPEQRQLGWRAYRGCLMDKAFRRAIGRCHPLHGAVLVENLGGAGDSTSSTCIRNIYPSPSPRQGQMDSPSLHVPEDPPAVHPVYPMYPDGPDPDPMYPDADPEDADPEDPPPRTTWTCLEGTGFGIRRWSKNGAEAVTSTSSRYRSAMLRPGGPLKAIVDEVGQLPGNLAEVILDGDQDPGPLLEALSHMRGRRAGVSALCGTYDGGRTGATWETVDQAMLDHPMTDDANLLVFVVDTNTVPVGEVDLEAINAPRLDQAPWSRDSWVAVAMGAALWETMKGLRVLCEREDFTAVVISTDLRPVRAHGPVQRTHRYTDTRVRSWIGDAGRYWCHQRYRVEPDADGFPQRVVTIKDEAEGLPGRLLYDRPEMVRIPDAMKPRKNGVSAVASMEDSMPSGNQPRSRPPEIRGETGADHEEHRTHNEDATPIEFEKVNPLVGTVGQPCQHGGGGAA